MTVTEQKDIYYFWNVVLLKNVLSVMDITYNELGYVKKDEEKEKEIINTG